MCQTLATEIIVLVPKILNDRICDLEVIKAELRLILDIAYDVADSLTPKK